MIIIIITVWIASMIAIVLWMALASKPDYTIDWSEKVEHKGVVKLKNISMPDEIFEDYDSWHSYIQKQIK
jgi:hypothetical protein